MTTLATSSSDNAPIPFSISFLDDPVVYLGDDPTVPSAVGLLVIGDYQEEFCATLYEWTKDDYQAQWRNAILALLHGEDKVALMVYYVSQVYSDNIEWWPMYKLGETVVFQNQMPWYDQFRERFSLDRPFNFVNDYKSVNEDGEPISEWSVPFASIRHFAMASGWLAIS